MNLVVGFCGGASVEYSAISFPFEYTNDWGAAIALLTPFAILGWKYLRTRSARNVARILLALAVIPVVLSMNRGLWVSLSVGLLYAALRMAQHGRGKPLGYLLFGVAVVGMLVLFSPLRGVIEARIEHGHSDEGRTTLYQEAARGVAQSPLFGYGSPGDSVENPNLPSVGTHGQFWLVLYSNGIPAIVFYVGWYLIALWRMRRGRSDLVLWCQVVVLIATVQLAFYGQLPAQLNSNLSALQGIQNQVQSLHESIGRDRAELLLIERQLSDLTATSSVAADGDGPLDLPVAVSTPHDAALAKAQAELEALLLRLTPDHRGEGCWQVMRG